MHNKRRGIALLITLMFVIVITVAIGFGLKQVNESSKIIKQENFLYQSTIIVEDILKILQNSQDVKRIVDSNNSSEFYIFLSQAAFIPFEVSGLEVVLKISSARGKFNPSQLDQNSSELMRQYLNNNGVNGQYLELLVDNMSKIKVDNSYNSRIFDEEPNLFRDYIASSKHLQKINNFYAKEYNDNALSNIDFDNLFLYTSDKNTTVDLNYATREVWELFLGASKERAEFLSDNSGFYDSLESLELNDAEKENLAHFKTSFFEPTLFIEIDISENGVSSKISFEYDIKNKRGSNFAYQI